MKFTVNHQNRFTNLLVAWSAGFMQASAAFAIEVANLLVLLSAYDTLTVMRSFLVLVIVSAFDDKFYAATVPQVLKDAIKANGELRGKLKSFYVITRTSSKDKSYQDFIDEHDTIPRLEKARDEIY